MVEVEALPTDGATTPPRDSNRSARVLTVCIFLCSRRFSGFLMGRNPWITHSTTKHE